MMLIKVSQCSTLTFAVLAIWGCQTTGPTISLFMFISKMLSATRADANVIFSKIVSPV